ncbi:MAG: hypothetical protein HY704_10295 [Gemmatimonadetes bacterium]|nr:hypothetical protein [Gemmatimonadota bacterium]
MTLGVRELDELKRGEFRLECLDMTLDNGDPKHPKTFKGPGEVHFVEGELLEFVLYDSTCGPVFPSSPIPAGEWLPQSEFYDLRATDLLGREWLAEDIRPDTNSSSRSGAVVRGWIRELSLESSSEKERGHALWLYFASPLKMPLGNVRTETIVKEGDRERRRLSVDVWEVSCGTAVLRFRRGDLGVEVEVVPMNGEALPPGIDTRIEEGIWFALSEGVTADALQQRSGRTEKVIVRSRRRGRSGLGSYPPFKVTDPGSARVVGSILCTYLEHVLPFEGERFHPLSVLVRQVLRARGGTLEEEARAACIAVEGVVDRYFREEYGSPDPGVVASVTELQALLKTTEWPQKELIEERVRGAIGRLTGTNARSAILSMGRSGAVESEQVRAWEDLRPLIAHGAEIDLAPRELLEKTVLVRQLFNTLVLKAIGYRGQYTDYSTVGWPSVNLDGGTHSDSQQA